MMRIELPSGELAEELLSVLEDRRFSGVTCDKGRRTVQFPDETSPSQWAKAKDEVEKWAKEKRLEVSESLNLRYPKSPGVKETEDPKVIQAETKKKVENLTPEKAEERYRYLSSKPISELSEAEYQERLTLASRPPEKKKNSK